MYGRFLEHQFDSSPQELSPQTTQRILKARTSLAGIPGKNTEGFAGFLGPEIPKPHHRIKPKARSRNPLRTLTFPCLRLLPAVPQESPPENMSDRDWTAYEQTEKIQTQKFHIIRKRETLSDVARQYYGSPAKWQKIYNANRDIVTNPNAVRPGTKLILPD